jgi:hypothetical protein
VDAGSGAFTLNLSGQNFVPGSSVLWNGVPLSATVSSGTQASVQIGADLVAEGQTVSVAIVGPGPNAPVSSPRALEVTVETNMYFPRLGK